MFRYRLAYLLLIGFGVFFYIAFVGYFSYYFLLLKTKGQFTEMSKLLFRLPHHRF